MVMAMTSFHAEKLLPSMSAHAASAQCLLHPPLLHMQERLPAAL